MADVLDVATAVINEVAESGADLELTALKLQKLVYYSQVWYLVENGITLFDEPIEAWRDGPVVPKLWKHFAGLRMVHGLAPGSPERLSSAERSVVRRVVFRYGRFTAEQLSSLTHRERPWRLARADVEEGAWSDNEISVDVIRSTYAKHTASPLEAVDLAVASSRLEGLISDGEHREILEAVARGEVDVDEAVRLRISQLHV